MTDRMFYIYEHWRPDKDVCFYVGKGKGRRANVMSWRNPHHQAIQTKLARLGMCVEVRLITDCLTEEEAFAAEIDRITFWRELGAPLVNRTGGGEGLSNPIDEVRQRISRSKLGNRNMVGRHLSEETKAKIGAAHKGRAPPPGLIERLAEINRGNKYNVGKKLPLEVRQKMSATRTGNKYALGTVRSAEDRQKMSAERKSRNHRPSAEATEKSLQMCRKPVRCTSDGLTFISAADAARHYGMYNHSKIAEVCRGKRKTAVGRVFEYI